jgi:REP element-mobilizing transposase RayT
MNRPYRIRQKHLDDLPAKARRAGSLRLCEYDYSHSGAYFITICARKRELLFGDVVRGQIEINQLGQIVQKVWLSLPQFYGGIELDEFIIMPNHVHDIVMISSEIRTIHASSVQRKALSIVDRRRMLLCKIIGRFKMVSAKNINLFRKTSGLAVWQRSYYEHIVRDEVSLNRIRRYIADNPSQWEFDEENPAARTSERRGDSRIAPSK